MVICGKLWEKSIHLNLNNTLHHTMSQIFGEYDCKVDTKGRFKMPTQLSKKLGSVIQQSFVVNRGIENCLVLYTHDIWQKISEEVNGLNMFVAKNRKFARYFYRGATELKMDKTGRMLIPKRLLKYAKIDKEIVLFAYNSQIEIWSKALYEDMLEHEPDDFASLAEEVMGKVFN